MTIVQDLIDVLVANTEDGVFKDAIEHVQSASNAPYAQRSANGGFYSDQDRLRRPLVEACRRRIAQLVEAQLKVKALWRSNHTLLEKQGIAVWRVQCDLYRNRRQITSALIALHRLRGTADGGRSHERKQA